MCLLMCYRMCLLINYKIRPHAYKYIINYIIYILNHRIYFIIVYSYYSLFNK